jgi:hypothetical protein
MAITTSEDIREEVKDLITSRIASNTIEQIQECYEALKVKSRDRIKELFPFMKNHLYRHGNVYKEEIDSLLSNKLGVESVQKAVSAICKVQDPFPSLLENVVSMPKQESVSVSSEKVLATIRITIEVCQNANSSRSTKIQVKES